MNDAILLSAEQLAEVRDLYERGLFIQAYRAAGTLQPLSKWLSPAGLVMAGRLSGQLGCPALGARLVRAAAERWPDDPEVAYYHGGYVMAVRGPYAGWRAAMAAGQPRGDLPEPFAAWWCALLAEAAAALRDFERAGEWIARATERQPSCAWVWVCRSRVSFFQDCYEEALAAARHALELHPWYCPAVSLAAHLLTLLDRDGEAVALLCEAASRLQSAELWGALSSLLFELQQYPAAAETLERSAELAPLASGRCRRWLDAQRSHLAYFLGDVESSIRLAKQSRHEAMEAIARRMEEPERQGAAARRLPVGFVRQHHMTCVPATLSAISRYWSQPADHLQVAEEICYNGTSAYNERKWAEQHGWAVREFAVTEPKAAALLDAGIPFTFTSIEAGSAHLQAVIGYEGRRGTWWIRDPFWRNTREVFADKFLERYRAFGPRGMALAPAAQRARLEAVDLPDAPLWDRLHALDEALETHRRDDAARIAAELQGAGAESRMGLEARRRIALYDANPAERLAVVEESLALAPDNACLQLERLACLQSLGRREQRLAVYAETCAKRTAEPIFLRQYAEELRPDARRHDEAIRLLRRAIRRAAGDPGGYQTLAHILWDRREFDEALDLYRFAACLDDKDENCAESYCLAAVWCKRREEALGFLRARYARYGRKSDGPARTLATACLRAHRTTEALAVLEEAMGLRPDDGPLALFAADSYVASSSEHLPRALALLEGAKANAPPALWLYTAARIANNRGRLEESLGFWRQLLDLQPLGVSGHMAVAQLLAETRGRPAALEHLRQAVDRFPYYQPLVRLHLEWLREEPPAPREEALRAALVHHPHDAWIHRELALLLAAQGRLDEARAEADLSLRLEPAEVSSHVVEAHVLEAQQKIGEARASLRRAIELSVDNDHAISGLVALSHTPAERRAALAFVKEQMIAQTIFGEGLLSFQQHAEGTLDDEELLGVLREALAARGDLWHSWSACLHQLLKMNRCDEAGELARQATERFPLLPALWLDLAWVGFARGDAEGERAALETACEISPDWGRAIRALCELHQRRGQPEESRRLLEEAIARNPLEAAHHAMLAELLWKLGEREAALDRVRRAVDIDPRAEAAWGNVYNWSVELDRRAEALEVFRQLAAVRGGQAGAWLMLAKALEKPEERDERLAALDKAIALSPRYLDAHDLRAVTLAEAGRWDEARAACRPAAWDDCPPTPLAGRAAWIQARQGDVRGAVEHIRRVLGEEPSYYAGWAWLYDWCRELEDHPGCLEAAEALVRINPHHEINLGYLGQARWLNQDIAGARAALARALEMKPDYEFAGNLLFDLQMEADEVEAAGQTLAHLQRHSQSAYVQARAVQWAARRRDPQAAAEALRSVCVTSCESAWPIAASVHAMESAGWGVEAEGAMTQAIAGHNVQAEGVGQWVRLRSRRRGWFRDKKVREMLRDPRHGPAATEAFLEALVRDVHQPARGFFTPSPTWRLRRFLKKNRAWLAGNTLTWGSVLRGLYEAGLSSSRIARSWIADWQTRAEASPAILINLVELLRAQKMDAEAVVASRRAIALPPDQAQQLHRLWLAAEAASAGEVDQTRLHLAHVIAAPARWDYRVLEVMAQAVVEMHDAGPSEAKLRFSLQRRRLNGVCDGPMFRRHPGRRRLFLACVRRVAAYRGTWGARLWSWITTVRS